MGCGTSRTVEDALSYRESDTHALNLRSDPKCYRKKRTANGCVQFQRLTNIALGRVKTAHAQGLGVDAAVADYNAGVAQCAAAKSRRPRQAW